VFDAESVPDDSDALATRVFALTNTTVGHDRGQITVHDGRRAGWFVAPDNQAEGAIESLLRQAFPAKEAACVDALFACVGQLPGDNVAQRDKAWLAAALAARTGSGRLSWALEDPAFRDELRASPVLEPLITFLRTLITGVA
jgi:hypothetical protein